MNRRAFLCGVTLGALFAPVALEAQQPGKITTTLGFLLEQPLWPLSIESFRRALVDRGWAEGQNLRIERRSAEGNLERLPELAADLVRLKVALIVTGPGTPSALAAKAATASIPIVFVTGGDPVDYGIVSNLARPGGNITGFGGGVTVVQKRLELLRELAPHVKQVAFLANAKNPIHPRVFSAMKQAAQQLDLTMHEIGVRDARDFAKAFETMQRRRMDALFVPGDAMFNTHRTQLIAHAAKSRLPTVYGSAHFPEDGGLMSLGVNQADLFRRAASHVDKILQGANAGELPVEEAVKFELMINARTAKALDLAIPQSLLLRADRVIE